MKKQIQLSYLANVKKGLETLQEYGGSDLVRSYLKMTMSSNSSDELQEAIIYLIKEMGLFPEHKNLLETLLTFR